MQNRPKKVTAISLDYDDCGDILFDDHLSSLNADEKQRVESAKNILINYFSKITHGSDVTYLCVGSFRQDMITDEAKMLEYKNGSCFKNYAGFCKKQGWLFNEFLLADAKHHKPAGTAMKNRAMVAYSSWLMPSKVSIANLQLENISKAHPDADVYYYFVDDDGGGQNILENLAADYKTKPRHNNIRNFELTKYDYYEKVRNNSKDEILSVYARFPSETHGVTASRTDSSTTPIPPAILSQSKHGFWESNTKDSKTKTASKKRKRQNTPLSDSDTGNIKKMARSNGR